MWLRQELDASILPASRYPSSPYFVEGEDSRDLVEQSEQSGLSLCLDVDDLDAAIAHLINLGYPPPGEIIVASHGREIYAYDPNGNRLILHQPPH